MVDVQTTLKRISVGTERSWPEEMAGRTPKRAMARTVVMDCALRPLGGRRSFEPEFK